ncbi:MAG: pyridoxamine 5'-phosphate oxidase [Actinobacteria bacterium]|nr:pyridoxamine 5'-phosphate oxidase [Actinomycetota bacterium]
MAMDAYGDLNRLRVRYETGPFNRSLLADEPYAQLVEWLVAAERAGVVEPNAFSLATTLDGQPDVRVVLAKSVTSDGISFFTNLNSAKGRQLLTNNRIAGCFAWIEQHRQVRFQGSAERLPDTAVADYFATRPRDAQIGAWVSAQSSVIVDRESLVEAYRRKEREFDLAGPVPVPPHWGGFLLRPDLVEFWQGQPSRLHDRLRFRGRVQQPSLNTAGDWIVERLAP